MNIKSLLLGSTAALLAVSGARAADAVEVAAEPEPMEYVRICDTYGTGYYYIPGTETCLSIAGHVRYQINFADGDEGWRKQAQARLNLNAKSETELGTLTAYIRLEGNTFSGVHTPYDDVDVPESGFGLVHALISLGGFSIGLNDSLYDNDMGWLENENAGGYDTTHQLSYTFDFGSGFNATLGLEEENNNTDYIPNVVARIGVTQGWGNVNLYVAYDDDDDGRRADDAFLVKAIGQFNVSEQVGIQAVARYESDAGSFYSNGYEWSAGAALHFQASEKVGIALGGEYYADAWDGGGNDWTIGTVVDYQIVPQFNTKFAVNYYDGDSFDEGTWRGFLRFERGF